MTQLAEVLLTLHIAAGFIALVAGGGAMMSRKGERFHLRSGRLYFWAMAVVAATALPLAALRSSVFLFAVAILSFSLAFNGYRVVIRRRRGVRAGEWWATHMRSMLGAYIATFTAFAVTNATFLPPLVRWLAPTVAGSIGIAVWVERYRRARQGP